MATIVHLNDHRRKMKPSDGIPAGGATIHLFLGVRYERHDDTVLIGRPMTPASGGNGRKTRKRA